MAKLTLSDLANLTNETTAVTTINANNALIETALENTLSRDGTSPNTMGADLDMNSHRILNVPEPSSGGDVATKTYVDDVVASGVVGATGPAGANGSNGADGSKIFVQPSAPSTSNPANSLWYDSDSSDIDVYQLVSSVWVDTGLNAKGSPGTNGTGSGDVTGPASTVNNEIALWNGTSGDVLKSATTTGILKGTSGVLSAAVSGTDYAPATSGTSILKGSGSGGFSNASAGTDYYAPGSTDVALADGGTGASLADPNDDRIMFWDDSAGAVTWLDFPAAGLTTSTTNIALANDLAALEGLSSTGLAARTASDTWAQRTITAPAAGITVSNGDGVSGNPTLALANDLSAVEGLSSTGLATRTASDTWTARTITAGTGISVTNGDGVSGNPTVALTSAYQVTGKQTIWIPASSMVVGATSRPAQAVHEIDPGDNYAYVLDFDGAGTNAEVAYFQIAFPKSWDEGTISYQVYWYSTAVDTDTVLWTLQAFSISDTETIDGTWGTAVNVTDSAAGAANRILISSESSALTVANTPAAGDICFFRFYRQPGNGSDTHAEDARLLGIKLFYTTDAGNDA